MARFNIQVADPMGESSTADATSAAMLHLLEQNSANGRDAFTTLMATLQVFIDQSNEPVALIQAAALTLRDQLDAYRAEVSYARA